MSEAKPVVIVSDLLRTRSERDPDRVALHADGGEIITYGQWQRRVDRTARGLLAAGVARGERVALLFGGMDWIDYAVAYMAVLGCGATGVHLNDRLTAQDQYRRLAECGVKRIIRGEALRAPEGYKAMTVAELDSGDESPVKMEIGPADIADVLYTSGTTGLAKGFTNPHGNLTFGRGPEGLRQFEDPTPLLAPMPLGTTSSSTTVAIIALTSPAVLILCRIDDVERMGQLIHEHRIGSIMITPIIAMRMIATRLNERYDVTCVDRIAIASAPLPPTVSLALLRVFPNAGLSTAYSQSEAVPAVIVNTFDPARPATVGRPAPGTRLRVVNEKGEPVPAGEVGEIWLSSDAPRRVYLDPERDASVHVGEWTRTGDLGYQDSEGYLYLFDRMTDVLRVGGKMVSSVAVEAVLYEHPAVSEAAVVAFADATGEQQTVAAAVVLNGRDGLPELSAFLAERLRPEQVPAQIHVLDSLPRGITGKVLKNQLRRQLASQEVG